MGQYHERSAGDEADNTGDIVDGVIVHSHTGGGEDGERILHSGEGEDREGEEMQECGGGGFKSKNFSRNDNR